MVQVRLANAFRPRYGRLASPVRFLAVVDGKSSSARGGVRDAHHAGINRAPLVASKRWCSSNVVPQHQRHLGPNAFPGVDEQLSSRPSRPPSGPTPRRVFFAGYPRMADTEFEEFRHYFEKLPQHLKAPLSNYTWVHAFAYGLQDRDVRWNRATCGVNWRSRTIRWSGW